MGQITIIYYKTYQFLLNTLTLKMTRNFDNLQNTNSGGNLRCLPLNIDMLIYFILIYKWYKTFIMQDLKE